ncbi:hypothetical protein [Winogradskyella forsetii]|uniref:hypothetical protein n=1 Tax=Winogradskyella forsetii TaxID=2686077 RepID=UPI0015B90ED5|nr:hypothetical protein [Winogradskyella forsetii]
MNNLQTINTEYLRASRTIETILVSNQETSDVFFVYNYEGYSFRLFENHFDLISFFLNGNDSQFHFSTESELDDFLSKVKIK